MQLTSAAFQNHGEIPSKYTCDGQNFSPPLQIAGIPEGTQSLALIVDDPDAPRGDWVHWLLWNINPSVNEIAENKAPAGAVEGTTDFGRTGWGGPCPPSGSHRYFFKIYALNGLLDLAPSAMKSDLETAMRGSILATAELIGTYERVQQP